MRKGIRANVYEIAAKYNAIYFNNKKEESIFYDGDYLYINLLFINMASADSFLNQLYTSIRYFQLEVELEYNETFEKVYTNNDNVSFVFSKHYVSNETDSEV